MQDVINPKYLFTSFAEKAEAAENTREEFEEREEAKNKAVTQYFKTVFQEVLKTCEAFEDLDDEEEEVTSSFVDNLHINPKLTSHSSKKHAVNLADELPSIKTTWVCFRAGWLMRTVHTIYDYLTDQPKNDRQIGRALSGWRSLDALGTIGGGRPPTLDSIHNGNQELSRTLDDFVTHLFHRYDSIELAPETVPMDLKRLLAATIIRYLPNFITLLLEHPRKDFGDTREGVWEKHKFLMRLKQACDDTGIAPAQLEEWSTLVERDFIRRNFNFVAFERIQEADAFRVDTRSLNSTMASLSTHMASLAITSEETRRGGVAYQQSVNHEIASIRQEMTSMRQDIATVKGAFAAYNRKVDTLLVQTRAILRALTRPQSSSGAGNQRIVQEDLPDDVEGAVGGPDSTLAATAEQAQEGHQAQQQPNLPVAQAARLSDPLPDGLSGQRFPEFFENWHYDEYHKSIEVCNNKRVRSDAKIAIEYFSLFLPRHPSTLPANVSSPRSRGASAWKSDLQEITRQAWETARAFFQQQGKDHVPSTVLGFKKTMTTIEADNLPLGPVGETPFQPSGGDRLRCYDDIRRDHLRRHSQPQRQRRPRNDGENRGGEPPARRRRGGSQRPHMRNNQRGQQPGSEAEAGNA
jgi:hypothetical protein